MGAQARHRASTTYSVEREMFGWMIIYCLMFGLLFAVARDASRSGDMVWAGVFYALTLLVLGVYFYIVSLWVKSLP